MFGDKDSKRKEMHARHDILGIVNCDTSLNYSFSTEIQSQTMLYYFWCYLRFICLEGWVSTDLNCLM